VERFVNGRMLMFTRNGGSDREGERCHDDDIEKSVKDHVAPPISAFL
jgi:hypothetical protein